MPSDGGKIRKMKTPRIVTLHRWQYRLIFTLLQLTFCYCLTHFTVCFHRCCDCTFSNGNCLSSFSSSNAHVLLASVSPLPSYSVNDSEEELESIRSWKATSARAKEAKIIFRAPSLLDSNAFVEVKQRTHGWHTLGMVGGPTKSIFHGVFQKDKKTGRIDPYALGPSEYIRAMASVALCLSAINVNDTKSNSSGESGLLENIPHRQQHQGETPLSFLHMGYGSGSLMRLLRHAIPKSEHTAIDLDPTVVDAAVELGLLDPSSPCETLEVGDALEYPSNHQDAETSPRFHGVCIDVFDGANLMPSGFYAVSFLEQLRDNLLQAKDRAFVIHNFHVGTERLDAQLKDAMESYRNVFGTCPSNPPENMENTATNEEPQKRGQHHSSLYRVDSLNTNNRGGNTILIAIVNSSGDDAVSNSSLSWLELAVHATERWEGKRFDLYSRIEHVRPF